VGRVGGRRQKSSVQAADRRLLKLFRAGYLDRFRPISRRGSFPWTYQLGLEGHRLLQRAGIVGPRERFVRREVYDYGHVLHDLQLNAWVLAYRRAAGLAFLSWDGETHIEPPPEARARQGVLSVGDYWSAERLCDPRARQVRPDAVIEVARPDGDRSRVFFIEFDRIRRVDKNYEKFRRYDSFLCWWWQHTSYADGERPFVIFICQDEDQRDRFLTAADRELTGQLWHPPRLLTRRCTSGVGVSSSPASPTCTSGGSRAGSSSSRHSPRRATPCTWPGTTAGSTLRAARSPRSMCSTTARSTRA
jgi:hypothetical protein